MANGHVEYSESKCRRNVKHIVSHYVLRLILVDARKGYSMDFGARELERTITDTLQTYLADYFLIHNVSRGDSVHVTKDNLIAQ